MTPQVDLASASWQSLGSEEALRERPVVLFGAGHLGQRILDGLRSAGIEPRAFADNNVALWGTKRRNIEVLSPHQAALRFGSTAIFVIAVWRPAQTGGLKQIYRQLRESGCDRVVPFAPVLWSFPEKLLPHYLWDLPSKMEPEEAAISQALELFKDPVSRSEFTALVEYRRTGNFELLPQLPSHPQYFADFLKPIDQEHFVDCGAFDGDTIASFAEWTGGRFAKIDAFEADPACFEKLRDFVSARTDLADKITLHALAVACSTGRVRFDATGGPDASISGSGQIEVPATTLDEALRDTRPTFIKMDIEGAEPDALRGASEIIQRTEPVLAICVYHRQNQLWQIPLLMQQLLPTSRLFLRTYCLDGLDTVCYAVPEHRLGAIE